jgi:hypothetical protein
MVGLNVSRTHRQYMVASLVSCRPSINHEGIRRTLDRRELCLPKQVYHTDAYGLPDLCQCSILLSI